MDIPTLCADSVRIATEKGWLSKPRKFSTVTALFHSEPSEALEDYRAHHPIQEVYFMHEYKEGGVSCSVACEPTADHAKPCGIPIEIADTVIRIAQHCGSVGWDLDKAIQEVTVPKVENREFDDYIAEIHLAISLAYGAYLSGKEPDAKSIQSTPVYFLALAMKLTIEFCASNGIDLDSAVAMKQDYNAGRAFRHGGKLI